MTPLWGAHLFLVLLVCVPLGLDAPVAYLAANISIPVIAPFLTMAELEIGSLVLTGTSLPTSLALVQARGAGLFVKEVAVGTLLFSPAMALLGGALTYTVARLAGARSDGRDEALSAATRAVAQRYAASGPAFHYVRAKLAGDPVARRVAELGREAPLGEVLDAGSGRGQLGLLLLTLGVASGVTGFDWDAKKVAIATRAAEASTPLAARFRVADLRTADGGEADTALLIDVLHYLADDEQDAVVRAVARRARRLVVVRELDPDRGMRSAMTRAQEAVTTALGYNRGARVHPRPIADLRRALEEEGFAVEVSPCWGRTPLSNVLLVARRIGPLAGTTSPGAHG